MNYPFKWIQFLINFLFKCIGIEVANRTKNNINLNVLKYPTYRVFLQTLDDINLHSNSCIEMEPILKFCPVLYRACITVCQRFNSVWFALQACGRCITQHGRVKLTQCSCCWDQGPPLTMHLMTGRFHCTWLLSTDIMKWCVPIRPVVPKHVPPNTAHFACLLKHTWFN